MTWRTYVPAQFVSLGMTIERWPVQFVARKLRGAARKFGETFLAAWGSISQQPEWGLLFWIDILGHRSL
jgi:hypothetical protein